MKTVVLFFLVALTALLAQPVLAQASGPVPPADNPPAAAPAPDNSAPPPPATSGNSAAQAVNIAKDSVDASLRDRVVSVYGVGTPQAITKWWVIFYDPTVPSHGRAVRVENGAVVRTYEAKGGVVYDRELTFPRSWVTGEGPALQVADDYAANHNLSYDSARVLLRITSPGQSLRWRVELMNGEVNKGFVFVHASSGTFATYAPPGSVPTASHTGTGDGGVVGDAKKFGNDVKKTFLGIGGDLQEFFTGERTVDQ
jgi:hypothetical protein